MNYLQRYGTQLIHQGYNIIPISKGLKYPKNLTGWQQTKATPALVDQWISAGYKGVGILSATCPAVDLDIRDADMVVMMLAEVKKICGVSLRRVGQPPKILLPYQLEGAFFRKVDGPTYEDDKGNTHKVEILSNGQQFVAYGEHPDTGKGYEWVSKNDLSFVPLSKLPFLDRAKGLALIEAFKALVARERPGWKLHKSGSNGKSNTVTNPTPDEQNPSCSDDFDKITRGGEGDGKPEDDDIFGAYRPKLALTEDQIQSAIEDLDEEKVEDYGCWIKVGMALWHQTDGSEWGFSVWDTWSQKSAKYGSGMRQKWRSFASTPGVVPVTFATVRGWANDARMDRDPLGGFIGRYVYVQDGDEVHDVEGYPNDKNPKLYEFKNMQAPIRSEVHIPAPTLQDEARTRVKVVPVSSLWMVDRGRMSASGYEYTPNRDGGRGEGEGPGGIKRLRQDAKGRIWVNQFYMPDFRVVKGADKVLRVFFDHIDYLFPVVEEREWFLSWMAFNLQSPEIRCKVTPLHIAPQHGTGRGWLVELMEILLGHWNCSKTKISNLVGEGGGGAYNEYMYKTLFCAIEEVHEGSKPYKIGDQIRDILSEKRLSINIKHKQKGTFPVYTNFFMMSNHVDALVLEEEDRRINVFITRESVRSESYYNKLYSWLIDKHVEGPSALWHWLLQRDIRNFNWHTPMHTVGRDQMIEYGRSDISLLFHEFIKELEIEGITFDDLTAGMQKFAQANAEYSALGEQFFVEGKKVKWQIKKLTQQYGVKMGRIKVDGEKKQAWLFGRNAKKKAGDLEKMTENVGAGGSELRKMCLKSSEIVYRL